MCNLTICGESARRSKPVSMEVTFSVESARLKGDTPSAEVNPSLPVKLMELVQKLRILNVTS